VDTTTRLDATLEIGGLAEAITVQAESVQINTVDASIGNTMSQQQIRSLPIEALNVVHLLSIQPGAVFIPTANPATVDPRYGAVSGARADQQNVTLDGVDVNDPQFQTAYTSAVRMTQEALQEFRVSTSNYGADQGRSSGAQVSLVTRSGTNNFTGSAYWAHRNTRTSTNEFFLKLAQTAAGEPSQAPRLDKHTGGGMLGGPIRRNRVFFFGNFEALRSQSESPVVRGVPSDAFRDGVLTYQCAVAAQCPGGTVQGFTGTHAIAAGHYGLTPAEIAAIDPLGIGPSQAGSRYFKQYPSPNEPGLDGLNIMDFRFASPIEDQFRTFISRFDIRPGDTAAHSFFVRPALQRDEIAGTAQFPGQPPRTLQEVRNWGVATGHDWVVRSNLINTFRYGLTRIDTDTLGQTRSNYVIFRFIDPLDADTFNSGREPTTHNVVNDMSWLRGTHTVRFGTNMRFTRIPRYTEDGSYLSAVVNPSWVDGVGRTHMPGGAGCTTPGCSAVPAVASGFAAGYADAWLNILGVVSQARLRANYLRDGSQLPVGEPIQRRFASNEFEFYVQDTWQLHRDLTVTAGVRYSLFSPPWETNGLQVAPTINLGEWFRQRGENMASGIPSNQNPSVEFDLAGPANNRPHYYEWDRNNFAPRISAAWTPRAENGFFGWLTGGDRLVVRGGYSKVFDRMGHGLATQFDAAGSFGMATNRNSPFGAPYETDPAVRFSDISTMPPTMPPAPAGGFPATPPFFAGEITSSLDASLITPSSHMFNFVVGRELGRNFSIEAGYVGRLGRDLLVRRDLAMPLNLVDPGSGMDYFTAARLAIDAARGIPAGAGFDAYQGIAPIPYWENLFPGASEGGLTATQSFARRFNRDAPDYITTIWRADQFCLPGCSRFGDFAFFDPQYDSLAGVSSIGYSDYHALQMTLRKRFSAGYLFDLNYTLSQSKDLASQVERGSFFGNFGSGGYTGFLLNSWEPDLHYAYSDFDARHQVNFNWLAELPIGRGRAIGRDMNGVLNQVLGNWSVAGLLRWTSGFPFNVQNCRSCWATNWNLQGNAELVNPGQLPPTGTTLDAVDGRPSPFLNPEEALGFFRFVYPGEVGLRNVLRGDGYFTIDTSVSKAWPLWGNHRLRFRWDTFNLTNTTRFDVNQLNNLPDRSGFGRYDGSLATCDGQAGRCMQFALRYEF
jgi:hypothetical protein